MREVRSGMRASRTWNPFLTPMRCGLQSFCMWHDASSQVVTSFCSSFLHATKSNMSCPQHLAASQPYS
jgi:hypothetical protein